jgi:hypothetical protein
MNAYSSEAIGSTAGPGGTFAWHQDGRYNGTHQLIVTLGAVNKIMCDGQNRILAKKPTTDRQMSRTRCTRGDTGQNASTALGTARLVRRPWKFGETNNKIPKQ